MTVEPYPAGDGARMASAMAILALAHAKAGRAVIPLHSVMRNGACTCQKGTECDGRGKHPHFDKDIFPDGVTSATTLESTVLRWWGKWPHANVGIATGHRSGFWILDVDPRHGGDETLAELEQAYGELPHTVEALTVGGGRHIAFLLPREFVVRNIQTPKDGDPPLGVGLDLRGEGGYIVGAGSRGDGGRGWNWDATHHPDDTPIAEAPPWLLHMVQRAMNAGRAGPAAPIPEKIPHGQQHFKIVSFAGSMRERGATEEEIYAALVVFNRDRCEKPGTDEQMRKYARSMMRYTPQQAREETRKFETRQREKTAQAGLQLPGIIRGDQLMAMNIPAPRWAVPGIIPAGATLLIGRPKSGKSWLALQAGIAIAKGGKALGHIDVPQGQVLYLALEDTKARLQERMAMLLGGAEAPELLAFPDHPEEWPSLDRGGQAMLDLWFKQNPETRLVIVDTLAKARGSAGSDHAVYAGDYATVGAFKVVADAYGASVLIVHHENKTASDDDDKAASGTYGLTGAADGMIRLRRSAEKGDATLSIKGRDMEEENLALRWDTQAAWVVLGNADEVHQSEERQNILALLRVAEKPLRPAEVAELLGIPRNRAKQRLWVMAERGLVRSDCGAYSPVTCPVMDSGTGYAPITPVTAITDSGVDPFIEHEKGENGDV